MHDSFLHRFNDKSLHILLSLNVHSLVNKSPDDSQCVQYQTVHVLFFPTWLVRASTSPGWSNRVPGPAASGLWGIRHRVIHSPELPARGWSLLHVTVLSAHAAVPHGSAGREAGPKLQLFYGESQNPHEAPAGTECNPGDYYHIIGRTLKGVSVRVEETCRSLCYCRPSGARCRPTMLIVQSTHILQPGRFSLLKNNMHQIITSVDRKHDNANMQIVNKMLKGPTNIFFHVSCSSKTLKQCYNSLISYNNICNINVIY